MTDHHPTTPSVPEVAPHVVMRRAALLCQDSTRLKPGVRVALVALLRDQADAAEEHACGLLDGTPAPFDVSELCVGELRALALAEALLDEGEDAPSAS